MRHAVAGRKLGRDTEHRTALFRNLAIALFTHGQITTTKAKAKAVQPFVEKLITLAKRGDLASRRLVIRKLGGNPILVEQAIDWDMPSRELRAAGYGINKKQEKLVRGPRVVHKLFEAIAPRFNDRPGGYTRIIKLAKHRIGDGSDLVVLQLVGEEEKGPGMGGRFSRRRQQANTRTAFAARLRKKTKAEDKPAPPADEPAPEETESPEVEAQATESDETKDE